MFVTLPVRSRSETIRGPPQAATVMRVDSMGRCHMVPLSIARCRPSPHSPLGVNHSVSPLIDGSRQLHDFPLPVATNWQGWMATHSRAASGESPLGVAAQKSASTLSQAIGHCTSLQSGFDEAVAGILPFADPQVIEVLWSQRLDWDGKYRTLPAGLRLAPRPPVTETFLNLRDRVLESLDGFHDVVAGTGAILHRMRHSSPHALRGLDRLPEEILAIVKKLEVACWELERLFSIVTKSRSSMSELIRELESAEGLLNQTHGPWAEAWTETGQRRSYGFREYFENIV